MLNAFLNHLVEIINFILNIAGILFVLWGALEATFRVVWEDLRGGKDVQVEKRNRKAFASKLILGLEFFIAVDILSAFEHTTWESLGKLVALILIRAMLSAVLSFEMGQVSWGKATKKKTPR